MIYVNVIVLDGFRKLLGRIHANSDGQISTQLLANADVAGQDGQALIVLVTWYQPRLAVDSVV